MLVSKFQSEKNTNRSNSMVTKFNSGQGTNWASALVRKRSFSPIKTGLSRISEYAAVRRVFMVSGEFHGILHGSMWGHGIVM
jgi:hypothetical protein